MQPRTPEHHGGHQGFPEGSGPPSDVEAPATTDERRPRRWVPRQAVAALLTTPTDETVIDDLTDRRR